MWKSERSKGRREFVGVRSRHGTESGGFESVEEKKTYWRAGEPSLG